MDLDDILPQIGEFGKYQKLMLWLICLPACFPCGFCAFNQLFMTGVPDHWCLTPELLNLTVEQRKMLSIPLINGSFVKCQRYSVNYTEILEEMSDTDIWALNQTYWSTESCSDGFEYDTSVVSSSIVLDVCVITFFLLLLFKFKINSSLIWCVTRTSTPR